MKSNKHKLLILSRDSDAYDEILRESGLEGLEFQAFSSPDKVKTNLEKINIVLGDPNLLGPILPRMDHLEWVQSTWTGVGPLVKKECRKDYLLTNIRDVFSPPMVEYIFCHMLMHEKKSLERFLSQQQKQWDSTKPGQLRNKSIGIMGVGSIGKSIARTAKFFQMTTKGYARNPISCEFIDEGYTQGQDLTAFVRDLDYLVSTLPETPATSNLLDGAIFSAMKPKSLLINVGRGNILDEAALVDAVNHGQIAGAVLDVFKTEPLPPDHLLWKTKGIFITSHTAAIGFPEEIALVFMENYNRFQTGIPLKDRVDFNEGY
jgi:phosphoglycerate dehydrogenase-like enzyme